jgi:hypothetical protein
MVIGGSRRPKAPHHQSGKRPPDAAQATARQACVPGGQPARTGLTTTRGVHAFLPWRAAA